jgi:3-keto-disaccharide hydrolase
MTLLNSSTAGGNAYSPRPLSPPARWALAASLGLCALLISPVSLAAEKPAAASPATPEKSADWKPLFDGKTLKGWQVTDFAGHAEVTVDPKFKPDRKAPAAPALIFDMGAVLTGLTWTNPPPKGEYEVSLDAMKLDGSDFFCALTFPAGDGHCSLIVGGWGGGVVGISSVDGMDASENETTKFMSFDKNRWYHIRVRVTQRKIEAWIDQEKVVNLTTTDRRITVRPGEIELAQPFGLSAYQTKAAFRNFRLREL